MRGTLKMQSSRVLHYYLEELHVLGSELSLAAHLADVSKDLRGLAERSPDTSPHRKGEPYRLAVSGIYARLTATAARLDVEITASGGRRSRSLRQCRGVQGRSRHPLPLADHRTIRA